MLPVWMLGHNDSVADGEEKEELLDHDRHGLRRILLVLHQAQRNHIIKIGDPILTFPVVYEKI
jgi:hypothetical protein